MSQTIRSRKPISLDDPICLDCNSELSFFFESNQSEKIYRCGNRECVNCGQFYIFEMMSNTSGARMALRYARSLKKISSKNLAIDLGERLYIIFDIENNKAKLNSNLADKLYLYFKDCGLDRNYWFNLLKN